MRRAKQERVKSNLSQSSYTHTNTPTHASTHAHRSPNTWHVRVQAIWQLHVALINSHVHTYRLCQIHTHTQVLPRTQNVRTHAHSTRYRHVCSAEHKNRCMNIHSMFTPMHTPSPKSPTSSEGWQQVPLAGTTLGLRPHPEASAGTKPANQPSKCRTRAGVRILLSVYSLHSMQTSSSCQKTPQLHQEGLTQEPQSPSTPLHPDLIHKLCRIDQQLLPRKAP